jgi:hypothetical protein
VPRLRRFLHLERPRADRGDPVDGDPGPSPGRFEGVERPAARGPVAPARSGAQLDRFGPEPEPTIELVEVEGRQPFTRCMRCGLDSNVFATQCTGCGASLDTAPQRDFNERLWAARQAEAARESAALAERQALRDRAAAEDAAARRAAYEGLAREVGEQERRRLDAGGWGNGGWGHGGGYDPTPLGLRLLRAIADPRRRTATAVAGAGLLAVLVLAGLVSLARGGRGPTLAIGAALLVILFTPPNAWRRRRRRWWD